MNCSSVYPDNFLYHNLPKKKLAEMSYSIFHFDFFVVYILLTSLPTSAEAPFYHNKQQMSKKKKSKLKVEELFPALFFRRMIKQNVI